MPGEPPITLGGIVAAARRIAPLARHTPLYPPAGLTALAGMVPSARRIAPVITGRTVDPDRFIEIARRRRDALPDMPAARRGAA